MASDQTLTAPIKAPAAEAPHVVVVDDDPLFLRTFTANMENAGYRVTAFKRPSDGLANMLGSEPPAACILDWHMPEMDGLDMLRKLKAGAFSAPVMFLTGLNQPMFEETAFDQGAIEFVEKTRSLAVILKRLERMIAESHERPANTRSASVFVSGPLTLDHHIKRASWRGQQVALSLGEFEVTALLAVKAGTDVSYREIYDIIQDTGFLGGRGPEGYRANVRASIKRIRKKFAAIDSTFDALENYPGFGYRWKIDA